MLRSIVFSLLFFFSASVAQAQIVVSIKPLHSLVLGVSEGSNIEVTLLVDGKTSLHEFSLRPSQAKKLHAARAVFYIGDAFEPFLAKILPQLPATTQRVAMEKAKNMTLYPVRRGDGFAVDAHEEHGGGDLHLWMAPANARAMVAEIARVLSEIYPEHAALFASNAKKLDAKLAALDRDLKLRMTKLKDKPFASFHDATQYFDRAYGLHNIGAMTLHPDQPLSPKRVQALRAQIKAMGAVCVFREPEFEGKIIDNLMQGTNAKSGVLDAEATLLTPSADLYFQLMQEVAQALENCLSS